MSIEKRAGSHPNASEDEIKRFEANVSKKAFEQAVERGEKPDEGKGEVSKELPAAEPNSELADAYIERYFDNAPEDLKEDMRLIGISPQEYFEVRGLIKNNELEGYSKVERLNKKFIESEFGVAKAQRKLLQISPEQYLVLRDIPKDFDLEINREKELEKIIDSYKKNNNTVLRSKEEFLGDGAEVMIRFMGDVPLKNNKEGMIGDYMNQESKMNYKVGGKTYSIEEQRKDLNMSPEKFLKSFGILPKQESQSKPDIIA